MRVGARWVWRGVALLVTLLMLDYVVLPRLAGAEESISLLSRANLALIALAVVLEAASVASYSALTRVLLAAPGTPYPAIVAADLTGLGVSHAVPGGAAVGSAVRYRLLRRGTTMGSEDVVLALTFESVVSSVALVAILWVGLIASIPFFGLSPAYVTTAVVCAVVLGGIALALVGLTRTDAVAPRVAVWIIDRLPARLRPRLTAALHYGATRLGSLLANGPLLRASSGWALANWLFDAASLWTFLAAYGFLAQPLGLLVVYSVATLAASVPITPSGLGVIEALLIPAVVALGADHTIAVIGVISWRLFEFWVPIPLSGVTYLAIRVREYLVRAR